MKRYHSHGKLLLTGEYVVLDGALSLAVPTRFGQDLIVRSIDKPKLIWRSYNEVHEIWFEAEFEFQNNETLTPHQNIDATAKTLIHILNTAKQLNSNFLTNHKGYLVETHLEFPKYWGLGTSSTLITNIANWAEIDPYDLLESTFGGSGYDIACAQAKRSLTYQLSKDNDGINRFIQPVNFNPSFKDHLYFVHLNQKQNSREGIAQYRANTSDLSASISRLSALTDIMISCDALEKFQNLMDEHEVLISDIIKQTPVKERLFNDFKGSIKSLGAWGGDFVMVASEDHPKAYFNSKGYPTLLTFKNMVREN